MPLSIVSAMKAITALRQGAEAVGHIGAPSSPRQGAKVFHLSPSGAEVAHAPQTASHVLDGGQAPHLHGCVGQSAHLHRGVG